MKARHPILGLLAFALIVAVAGDAYASCTGSNRVDRDNAECLNGWWDNNSWPKKSTFGAQNQCPDWGKVVAKVDIKNAGDKTWHLGDGNSRTGSTSSTVRDIYCCKDLGDKMCNKGDRVSVASCKTQFEASKADDDCYYNGDPTIEGSGNTHCKFNLTCIYRVSDSEKYEHTATYTVPWNRADEIEFCVEHVGVRPAMSMSVDGC